MTPQRPLASVHFSSGAEADMDTADFDMDVDPMAEEIMALQKYLRTISRGRPKVRPSASDVSEDEQSDGGLDSMREELNQIDSAFDLERAIMGILEFTDAATEDEGPTVPPPRDTRTSSIKDLRDLLIGVDPTQPEAAGSSRRRGSMTAADLLRSLQQTTPAVAPLAPSSPHPSSPTSPRARLRPPDPSEAPEMGDNDDDEHDVFASAFPRARATAPRPPPLQARSASNGHGDNGGNGGGGRGGPIVSSPDSAAVQRQLDAQIVDVLVRAKKRRGSWVAMEETDPSHVALVKALLVATNMYDVALDQAREKTEQEGEKGKGKGGGDEEGQGEEGEDWEGRAWRERERAEALWAEVQHWRARDAEQGEGQGQRGGEGEGKGQGEGVAALLSDVEVLNARIAAMERERGKGGEEGEKEEGEGGKAREPQSDRAVEGAVDEKVGGRGIGPVEEAEGQLQGEGEAGGPTNVMQLSRAVSSLVMAGREGQGLLSDLDRTLHRALSGWPVMPLVGVGPSLSDGSAAAGVEALQEALTLTVEARIRVDWLTTQLQSLHKTARGGPRRVVLREPEDGRVGFHGGLSVAMVGDRQVLSSLFWPERVFVLKVTSGKEVWEVERTLSDVRALGDRLRERFPEAPLRWGVAEGAELMGTEVQGAVGDVLEVLAHYPGLAESREVMHFLAGP